MAIEADQRKKFEQCIEACAGSLYRVAFRLTGNATLANELVQETYLNAWRSIDSLKDTNKLRSWLFAIMRNQYSKIVIKENKAISTTDQIEGIGTAETTRRQELQQELRRAVQEAVNELDEKHRLPVLLVSMEGMTVDQAAEILQIPRGTVLSRLSRGREKLKLILTSKKIQTFTE